jgi:hypothetical protein
MGKPATAVNLQPENTGIISLGEEHRGKAVIVSHEHRFIFLKTRKTAGTSIELALRQLCGPDDIITPLLEDRDGPAGIGRGPQNCYVHSWWRSSRPLFRRSWSELKPQDHGFYNHMPAEEARALLNDDKVWRSYFKFAFDRNPWDRQVSSYHFRYRHLERPPPFSCYMRSRRQPLVKNYQIYSLRGDVCVDFVGRYEDLDGEFKRALAQIGLTFDSELPRSKAGFRPPRLHYREYYDDETRGLVREWYKPEIALLQYEF